MHGLCEGTLGCMHKHDVRNIKDGRQLVCASHDQRMKIIKIIQYEKKDKRICVQSARAEIVVVSVLMMMHCC